jgi:RND family efflux transporter MFP subunit
VKARHSKSAHVAALAAMALAALMAGCNSAPPSAATAPLPPLDSVRMAAGGEIDGRAWDGVVQAVNQATLSAQTSGRVASIAVDVNDRVAQGAVLLRLTAVEQAAAASTARAQQRAAAALASEAQARYKRATELVDRQLISRDEFDRVRAARDTAVAANESATAQVAQVEQQLQYTVVRAPFAGIVTARQVEPGETVTPGQPLLVLYAPGELRVEIQVPQSDAQGIRAAGVARLRLADGRRVEASKVIVFPSTDPIAHSTNVRVLLPELQSPPQPGQTVRVIFPGLGASAGLWLPARAVVQRGELSGVYVIRDDSVVLRQLRLGRRVGDNIEVIAGLDAGERVATDPVAALQAIVQRRGPAASNGT